MFSADLRQVGIPKVTDEGKLDFHALRTTYITFLLESDANVKEAMVLARHSTPDLTLNTYARTREKRLSEITETVAGKILDAKRSVGKEENITGA
jgi:integrase